MEPATQTRARSRTDPTIFLIFKSDFQINIKRLRIPTRQAFVSLGSTVEKSMKTKFALKFMIAQKINGKQVLISFNCYKIFIRFAVQYSADIGTSFSHAS